MPTRSKPLIEFEKHLAALIGRPSNLRPFICDGSPLECRVFLVGHNPATEMSADFWIYWSDCGFDKSRWYTEYLRERAERPLKPGKTRRLKVSPSRRVMDLIIESASISVLETNLYARPTVDAKSLNERDQRPFNFLLETVKPLLLVAHGKAAQQALVKIPTAIKVINVNHFSRGWSSEKAISFGRTLREFV